MGNILSSNHKYMEGIKLKKYDLEDRKFRFARDVRDFVDRLPEKVTAYEIGKQLIRSAGSVGANYIKANESLSKKDFLMRIKICKKEAKETCCRLGLTFPSGNFGQKKADLINESEELIKIIGAIIRNTTF